MEKFVIVNFSRAGIMGFESIVLKPGANKVSLDIWEKMEAHPTIKNLIEIGEIKLESEISDKKGLADLSLTESKELVESTIDSSLLESWKKSEKRKVVSSAIDVQLKKLNEAPIYRDSKEKKDSVE